MSRKKTEIAKLTEAIMKNQNIEDVVDLQSVLKQMLKEGVETLLEGELEEELGYDRYERQKDKTNYRNGKTL